MSRRFRFPNKPAWPYVLNAGCDQAMGLVGWWPGDPSRGSVLYDQSGRKTHAAIAGTGPFWGAGNGGGRSALACDGTDNRATFTNPTLLKGLTKFSVFAWINWSGGGSSYGGLYSDGTSGDFYFRPGTKQIDFYYGGDHMGGTVFVSGKWYQVGFTYDGATLIGYVNGVQDFSGAVASVALCGANTVGIGGSANANEWFNGLQEDTRVYNRPLSPTQVHKLWEPSSRWELRFQVGRARYFRQSPAGGAPHFKPEQLAFAPMTGMY